MPWIFAASVGGLFTSAKHQSQDELAPFVGPQRLPRPTCPNRVL